MALIYEFWSHDIPTDLVRGLLKELIIPYKEKVMKRRRNTLYDQANDEWSKIYVNEKDLVSWLKDEIETRLRKYG